MKFSTKSKYGIKAMMDLACQTPGHLISIKTIAERQKIPDSYLEQLFSTLRRAGLIRSVKGPSGGYELAKQARDITVLAIVEALDGEVAVLSDKEHATFQEDPMAYYLNTSLWAELDSNVKTMLEAMDLESMKETYYKLTHKDAYMYYI